MYYIPPLLSQTLALSEDPNLYFSKMDLLEHRFDVTDDKVFESKMS